MSCFGNPNGISISLSLSLSPRDWAKSNAKAYVVRRPTGKASLLPSLGEFLRGIERGLDLGFARFDGFGHDDPVLCRAAVDDADRICRHAALRNECKR